MQFFFFVNKSYFLPLPAFCCVLNCGSSFLRDRIRFFSIPKSRNFKSLHLMPFNELSRIRRDKWISAIRRGPVPEPKLKYWTVCAKHFISGQPAELKDTENPDWVPSVDMGYHSENSCDTDTKRGNTKHRKRELDVNYETNFDEKYAHNKKQIKVVDLDIGSFEHEGNILEINDFTIIKEEEQDIEKYNIEETKIEKHIIKEHNTKEHNVEINNIEEENTNKLLQMTSELTNLEPREYIETIYHSNTSSNCKHIVREPEESIETEDCEYIEIHLVSDDDETSNTMEIPASLLMSSGTYAYVAVKASIHASDSAVFGLNDDEIKALVKRFSDYRKEVINGVLLKASPIEVVNALGQLGYRVVATTGEAEIVWTMQRDI